MTQVDLQKLTVGLYGTWAGYLRDWDRSLRSANHPATTRYNYLLAAAQLARYLGDSSPDPDADAGSLNPAAVTNAHVEAFQAWMIETLDRQVKVRGYRIELGDVEWGMRCKPDMGDVAVVWVADGRVGGELHCFYTGRERSTREFSRELATVLPEYMAPTVFHHRNLLPLNDSGKTDHVRLAASVS